MAYRDEIARLEAMHAANPEGRVFAHLAEAYRKKGELERAREVLGTGLERHPQYASAHVVLGRVLLDLGDSAAADQAFRKVLELDPHNMVAMRARGDIARADGRTDEALEHYRELISLDPSDDQVVLHMAELEAGRPLAPAELPAEGAAEPDFGEAAPGYGDVALSTPADEASAGEPDLPRSRGAGSPDATTSDGGGGAEPEEVDLGIGGLLEPTDVGGPARDEAEAFGARSETRPEPEAAGEPETGLAPEPQPGWQPEPEPEPAWEPEWPAEPERQPEWAPEPEAEPEPESPVLPVAGDEPDGPDSSAIDEFAASEPLAPELDALAGLGAFEPVGETEPDAMIDFLEAASAFSLPTLDDSSGDAAPPGMDDFSLPGFDEIAADPTPVPESGAEIEGLPEAGAEPIEEADAAPLEMSAGRAEAAEFDALWAHDEDGAAGELPEGPELVTETIGDLYAQQGLSDRAAEIYEKLLAERPGDEALRDKLDAARAAAATEAGAPDRAATEPAVTQEVAAEQKVAAAQEPAAQEPEPESPIETPPADVTAIEEALSMGGITPEAAPDAGDDFSFLTAWESEAEEKDDALPGTVPGLEPTGAGDLGGTEGPPDTGPDVPAAWLGLEPIGGGDMTAPAEPEAPGLVEPAAPEAASEAEPAEPEAAETDVLERVEAAWTGGAGATADVESPFGWAEPDVAPDQTTIGDYLDGLISFSQEAPQETEPVRPSEPPQASVPSEAQAPPETPVSGETSATPVEAAPADDIDALFADVVEPATPETHQPAAFEPQPPAPPEAEPPTAPEPQPPSQPPASRPAPAGGFDDIDALFADVPDDAAAPEAGGTPTPATDEAAPSAPEPTPTSMPEPPAAPTPDAAPPASAGGFEWDPFAELTEPTPATGGSEAADAARTEAQESAAPEADDDEDIDMFRAWLQSLKR